MGYQKFKIISLLGIALSITMNSFASNFGTEKVYAQMYPPISFLPSSDNADYTVLQTEHHCLSGNINNRVFYAPVHLPTGAKPVGLNAIIRDNQSGTNTEISLDRTCNDFTGTSPNTLLDITSIISLSSGGNSGTREYISATASEEHHVNNLRCAYVLKLKYGACSSNNEVARVAVRYQRDLTPAPVSAPFSDVPVFHPFSQHINAFKSAGITGGCGGGKYCPDDPVTRGQMAVFLSKAMGLSWDDSNTR